MEKKEMKNGKTKKIGLLVFNILFWGIIVILFAIWLIDFINAKNLKEPKFCLKNEVINYDDGNVTVCTGLGYKVVKYDRDSMTRGYDFGPFFIDVKESN